MSDSPALTFQATSPTNTPTESQTMNDIIELTVTNGQPTTTSLAIAERFGKRHADVLRAIEGLECSKEFDERNFAPVAYKGGNGELRPMYAVTKDGFMFLAMGFTGKEAAAWKERFIAAFNAMERQLLENAAAAQVPQATEPLFLSHRADILVAADRIFRGAIRSSRSAGLNLPTALRRANRIAIEKTGVDMLGELQAQDHLADLEAKQGAMASHQNAFAANPLARQPGVQAFWQALQAGELGKVGHQPMLSQQLYRLYLHWCRKQGNCTPLNLPRLMNPLYLERCVIGLKKRYVKPDGELFGPVAFVYPKGSYPERVQPETLWLGDCVRQTEAALESLHA